MATDGKYLSDTQCLAGVDLSGTSGNAGPNGTAQYLFVKIIGSKSVGPCAANTDIPYGVLQNAPASGQPASVAFIGLSKVVAGAAIAAGAQIMPDTSGRAITQTGANTIAGIAIETAAAANQLITAFLAPSIGAVQV